MELQLDIDKSKLTEKLREYKNLDEQDGDMTKYLYEIEDDGIEIRMFPSGGKPDFKEYPVQKIVIEVNLDENRPWYDESLEYGMTQNLKNGDSAVYKKTAELIEEACRNAGFNRVNLTGDHGTSFTTELKVS